MLWYNPTTRSLEDRPAPETDVQAYALLDGNLNSDFFFAEYERLRASGMSVERALVSTGQEFRLRHLEFRAAR